MQHDERAILAAGNNADLYQSVFQAHGLAYDRRPFAFVGRDRPPPYYSNMTVTSPGAVSDVVAEINDLAVRFDGAVGLKDSFCEVDPEHHALAVLFEAAWIWRAPGQAVATDWERIDREDDLQLWEAAWKRAGSPAEVCMFPGPMLHRTDTAFFGKREGRTCIAGCIATLSDGCIGLSNVFASGGSDRAFAEAAAAVGAINPRLPVLGYEAGADLAAAKVAGFVETGRLRVLIRDRPKS
jgi:hypothetical protein